jgi:hypothetical protein
VPILALLERAGLAGEPVLLNPLDGFGYGRCAGLAGGELNDFAHVVGVALLSSGVSAGFVLI